MTVVGCGKRSISNVLNTNFQVVVSHFQPSTKSRFFYKGQELAAKYIPDLVIFERIVVEVKAVSALVPDHEAQLMNYMRITQSPVGYLINFGPIGKLECKRIVLSQFA